MERKIVLLDMDGTISNLYGCDNWLERLQKEDKNIYLEAKPLITEKELFDYLPKRKYKIVICSMTAKNSSREYHKNVIDQKNKWLDKYFPNLKERIYLEYGNDKNVVDNAYMLIDDSKEIRKNFKGVALNPMWL